MVKRSRTLQAYFRHHKASIRARSHTYHYLDQKEHQEEAHEDDSFRAYSSALVIYTFAMFPPQVFYKAQS